MSVMDKEFTRAIIADARANPCDHVWKYYGPNERTCKKCKKHERRVITWVDDNTRVGRSKA